MKKSHKIFITLIGLLLILGISFFIYDRYSQTKLDKMETRIVNYQDQHTTELKKSILEEQDKKLTTIENELSDKQDKKLNEIKDELADEQQKQFKRMKEGGHFAQGFNSAAAMKVAIAEYYMTENQLPDNNQQIGLPNPEDYADDTIKSVGIVGKGIIRISYTDIVDVKNPIIYLAPDVSHPQVGIKWRCVSTNIKDIKEKIDACYYDETYSTSESHKGS